jgi:metal-responsive CopG/Arc/MetJ family transcriptional regulator
MATQQVLVRLPEELVRRFRRCVSDRRRSEFIQRLLEQALPPADGGDSDPLYLAALAVERDRRLMDEMAEWKELPFNDGDAAGGWRMSGQ